MIVNKIVIDNLPIPRNKDNCFCVEQFLYDLYCSMPDQLSSDQFKVLDRLCKKIDVVREVFVFYKTDLSKSVSTIAIDSKYNMVLISILLYYAEKTDDFKFLNSGIKLFDLTQNNISKEIQISMKNKYTDLLNKLDILL